MQPHPATRLTAHSWPCKASDPPPRQPLTCLLRAASLLRVKPIVCPPESVLRCRNVEFYKNMSLSSLKCRPFKVITGQGFPIVVMTLLNSPHEIYGSSMDFHEK